MIKINRLRKPISMGLSLLLAFSIIHPVSAENSTSSKLDMKSGLAKVTESKVNAKLTKEFDGSEYVTYLVKMKGTGGYSSSLQTGP